MLTISKKIELIENILAICNDKFEFRSFWEEVKEDYNEVMQELINYLKEKDKSKNHINIDLMKNNQDFIIQRYARLSLLMDASELCENFVMGNAYYIQKDSIIFYEFDHDDILCTKIDLKYFGDDGIVLFEKYIKEELDKISEEEHIRRKKQEEKDKDKLLLLATMYAPALKQQLEKTFLERMIGYEQKTEKKKQSKD